MADILEIIKGLFSKKTGGSNQGQSSDSNSQQSSAGSSSDTSSESK